MPHVDHFNVLHNKVTGAAGQTVYQVEGISADDFLRQQLTKITDELQYAGLVAPAMPESICASTPLQDVGQQLGTVHAFQYMKQILCHASVNYYDTLAVLKSLHVLYASEAILHGRHCRWVTTPIPC